jgi:cytochrome c biogenesis protein CcmG/thiol:disulfide interchange protein DsbE
MTAKFPSHLPPSHLSPSEPLPQDLPPIEMPRRRRLAVLVPLALFAAIAALFLARLFSGKDSSLLPSVLIGHPAPQTALPPVAGLVRDGQPVPGLSPADFAGAVTVLNVWASWCVPCHDEAPLLMRLAADKRIRVVGMDQKDPPENARRFLGRYGNPYAAVGADANGRAGIEWGVYGVPENFIIGRDGKIAFKLVGPLTAANLDGIFRPEIEKAVAANTAAAK